MLRPLQDQPLTEQLPIPIAQRDFVASRFLLIGVLQFLQGKNISVDLHFCFERSLDAIDRFLNSFFLALMDRDSSSNLFRSNLI